MLIQLGFCVCGWCVCVIEVAVHTYIVVTQLLLLLPATWQQQQLRNFRHD